MGNGSGVSRGDRNRNARLERLRALVPVTNAIVGIDLAGKEQMVVVTDHDSKVIARRTFRCRAWDLGSALDWAAGRAAARGWAGVTVSCEPTGHRWRVLGQLAADRSMPFVCVQPVVTSWSRRTEDLTCDKTDEKDAVLIARLTAQLRCYVPEPVDETWGRLRHLGTRREQLVTEAGGQIQQIRDLLECAWPAALDTARQPFRSGTWVAALSVIAGRDGGDFARVHRHLPGERGQVDRALDVDGPRRAPPSDAYSFIALDGERATVGPPETRVRAEQWPARRVPASRRRTSRRRASGPRSEMILVRAAGIGTGRPKRFRGSGALIPDGAGAGSATRPRSSCRGALRGR
jgi:Transposase